MNKINGNGYSSLLMEHLCLLIVCKKYVLTVSLLSAKSDRVGEFKFFQNFFFDLTDLLFLFWFIWFSRLVKPLELYKVDEVLMFYLSTKFFF